MTPRGSVRSRRDDTRKKSRERSCTTLTLTRPLLTCCSRSLRLCWRLVVEARSLDMPSLARTRTAMWCTSCTNRLAAPRAA